MNKKIIIITVLFTIILYVYFTFRKPEIIFVQHEGLATDIVAMNFPLTKVGKLLWWKNNEEFLNEKYDILKRDENGNYYITIFDGSDWFKKISEANEIWFSFEHTDLFCFDTIKSDKKCIEKNVLMEVYSPVNGKKVFMIDGNSIIK